MMVVGKVASDLETKFCTVVTENTSALAAMTYIYPFPTNTILEASKMKEFADNFKLDENGRKLFRRIENPEGKSEIAHEEQYLLFPQCSQKACTIDMYKQGLVWKTVNVEKELNTI